MVVSSLLVVGNSLRLARDEAGDRGHSPAERAVMMPSERPPSVLTEVVR